MYECPYCGCELDPDQDYYICPECGRELDFDSGD